MTTNIFLILFLLNISFALKTLKSPVIFLNEKRSIEENLKKYRILLYGDRLNKDNTLKIEIYFDKRQNKFENLKYSYIDNELLKSLLKNSTEDIIKTICSDSLIKNQKDATLIKSESENNEDILYYNIEIETDSNAIYIESSPIIDLMYKEIEIKAYIDKNNDWIIIIGIVALVLLIFEAWAIYFYITKKNIRKSIINEPLSSENEPSPNSKEESDDQRILPVE